MQTVQNNGLINHSISVLTGDLLESSRRAAAERERRASTSTYQTEKTERFDLEESGEFLQAVEDPGRTAQNILDELDYQVKKPRSAVYTSFAPIEAAAMHVQAMEEMQTRLHPPNSSTHFSYNRVPWKLKVIKHSKSNVTNIPFSDP